MSKLIRLTILLLAISLFSKAQQPLKGPKYADSLQSLLRKDLSDSTKARVNFMLSDYWTNKDSLKAIQHLELGRKLGKSQPLLEALYYYYTGKLNRSTNRPLSEKSFMKTNKLLETKHTKEAYLFRAKAWHDYGVLQQYKDADKTFANIILNKAIPLTKQADDTIYLGKNYLDLGIVFKNVGQYQKAEDYCKTAIEILKTVHPPSDELVTAYHTIAENYILFGKYPPAKAMLDSAKILLTPYPNSELLLDYYAAEGMYFTVNTDYENALASLERGVKLAKKLNQRYEEQRLLLQKFYALYNQKSFTKAAQTLLHLAEQKEMMSLAVNRLQVFYGLAETYAGLGNMEQAYKWNKRYSELSDSVNASKLKNDIHELEIKYKDAEKQKKITKLEAEKQKAVLSSKNTQLVNWLLGITSAFLLIIAIFILYYHKNKGKLAKQREINYVQQLKEMEQRQQLVTTKAILEGEERERARVARDLHDGLGGMLAGVKINLSGWAANHDTQTQDVELSRIIGQLDNSVKELRLIARNMMPETLLKFGLETALRDLCESIMSENLHVDFQPFGINKDIPLPIQITVYRIVQEILTNTIRHSRATNIVLQCSLNEGIFFITAEDNGIGFDASILKDKAGMGLNNIKNRVEYLKGKVEIISAINEGTTVNIELNTKV